MTGWLKNRWLDVVARHTRYTDAHGSFRNLYRVSDPWQMASERQQRRFRLTNDVIQREFGHVSTMLEMGCGEGHQTEWLSRLCRSIHAFDVSARAIDRARQRGLPGATFSVSDVLSFRPGPDAVKYDLVVGCEVLYYVADLTAVVEKIATVADQFLVTYRFYEVPRMDPWFATIRGAQSETLSDGSGSGWKAVWRKGPAGSEPCPPAAIC